MNTSSTRRSFLKFGAMAAAPLAGSAALAAPALAGDDTAERLARLEDMESIRALHATLLRAINTGDSNAARALFVDPAKADLDPTIRTIALDHSSTTRGSSPAARGRGTTRSVVEGANAPRSSRASLNNSSPAERGRWLREAKTEAASPDGAHIALAEDRQTARLTAACTVHTETPINSNCTLVQMARLQGEGFVRSASQRMLEARFVKVEGAWKVERASFA